ncbi:MAG: terminase gpP N-terminus-related DNA-binding protein [Gammaproteobacteria bacterium]
MSIPVQLRHRSRRRVRRLRKIRSRIQSLRCRVLLHQGYCVATFAEMLDCARATVYRTVYR